MALWLYGCVPCATADRLSSVWHTGQTVWWVAPRGKASRLCVAWHNGQAVWWEAHQTRHVVRGRAGELWSPYGRVLNMFGMGCPMAAVFLWACVRCHYGRVLKMFGLGRPSTLRAAPNQC